MYAYGTFINSALPLIDKEWMVNGNWIILDYVANSLQIQKWVQLQP